MRKLTKKEVVQTVRMGAGRMPVMANSELASKVGQLRIGEGIGFSISEWPVKAIPNAYFMNVVFKDRKFSCKKMPSQKEWVLVRIK